MGKLISQILLEMDFSWLSQDDIAAQILDMYGGHSRSIY
jgi:hypothetical protein